MHTRTALLVSASVLAACSPRMTPIGTNVDAGPPNTLTVTGQVCTAVPDPAGFPVKVVLLVDQSGSTCVTDPPGSQQSPGFCETWGGFGDAGYPFQPQPARVRALNQLMTAFESQPNVSVAFVPFETNVRGVWPPVIGQNFARPDSSLRNRINILQSELGNASDTQGAIAYAYSVIANDIAQAKANAPEELPRTRYVVVLMTDGPPTPRCSSNDTLTTYADDLNPHGVWADTAPSFCNLVDPMDPDAITGFLAGQDRNQDSQLQGYVDLLRAFETTDHVGAVRFNAVFWTNDQALTVCGPTCQDLWGLKQRWPGPVAPPSPAAYAYVEARTMLQDLTTRGGGSLSEFANANGLAAMNFGGINMESFAARNVKKAFIPQLALATAWQGAWAIDQDGDGLPDSEEAAANLNPRSVDSDGDGFDDLFETRRASEGFDPHVKDTRGCDPNAPATLGCTTRDNDGDGLSQFAENYLGTSQTLVDTDRDGIPDGLEVRWGLDPKVRIDTAADSDGDGVTDVAELAAATDPHFADSVLSGITSVLSERTQSNGTTCYDFTVSGLPMLATAAATGVAPGVNQFKFWFAEAPELVDEDVGTWRAACTFARLDVSQSPAILVPPNLQMTLFESDFKTPQTALMSTSCTGAAALTP
ncbi:MAG: VWA domain-containing protein [Archangium sp.]